MNPTNIGIDIGTNYCLSAYYDGSCVDLIPFNNQENFLRSNITFSESTEDVLVGTLNNPNKNTVYDIKRLVGRQFNDLSFQKDMCNWTFTVLNNENTPVVKIDRNDKDIFFSDQQLLTILFSHIKKASDQHIKQNESNITGTILAVPSHFTPEQTAIFRKAAEDANLKVYQIIREPVAACIGYQSILIRDSQLEANEIYNLIFDCNAKSLNLSIVVFDKIKNIMIEKYWNTTSDICGDRFTKNLMDYFLKLYQIKSQNYGVKFQKTTKNQIRIACERMKCLLSENDRATLECSFLKESGIDLQLTRKEYNEINQIIIQDTLKYLKSFFEEINIPPSSISFIILIGGSCKIPIFKDVLTVQYPFAKVLMERDPESVIVAGLTLISERPEFKPKLLKYTLSTDIGDNSVYIMLKKGCPLPCSQSVKFCTCDDNQDHMNLDVYKGDSKVASENELVTKFCYKGIKPAPSKQKQVTVTFDVDINENLTVTAKEIGNLDPKAVVVSKIKLK